MSPEALAALHARAFTSPPPWSAASFAQLLESPHVALIAAPGAQAFALLRLIGPEAELLTIATDPAARRQGHGRALMQALEAEARRRQAEEIFLEVAEDNLPALSLYSRAGFRETGRRRGYYPRPGAAPVDALLMVLRLA